MVGERIAAASRFTKGRVRRKRHARIIGENRADGLDVGGPASKTSGAVGRATRISVTTAARGHVALRAIAAEGKRGH